LEASLKAARLCRAAFRLQGREFAPTGRKLSALKLILRIADFVNHNQKSSAVLILEASPKPARL